MSRFINPELAALVAYVPGEQPQDKKYIKLNTNESPYPPAPGLAAAVLAEAVQLQLYSDPEARKLKQALAAKFQLAPEQVFVSNGSDEILSFAFMSLFAAGVDFPDVSYGFYPVYAELYKTDARQIPLREDFSLCVDDYDAPDRNVLIANPNAPTGLMVDSAEIEMLLQTHPDRVVLVDEAYADFSGASCVPLLTRYDNLLVVRTFSKSYNLAGARLGYALGSAALIADLEKIKYSTNPYNVNRMTQAAGIAALEDEAYIADCIGNIVADRAYLTEQLVELGLTVLPSGANFVFAACPGLSGREYYQALRNRGLLVRCFSTSRTAAYVRISIGTHQQMRLLIEATKEIIGR